ncbi:MAG: phosphatidate cytidylyltransferase [Bacteroidota bacterium]
MSNFTQRVLTALVGVPIAIGAMWLGGWWFGTFIALAAAAAQREVYGLFRAVGHKPFVGLGLLVGLGASLRPLVPDLTGAALLVGTAVVVIAALWRRPEADRPQAPLIDTSATLFGVLYPALLMSGAIALREADLATVEAFWLTAVTIIAVWGSDTFAYLTGRAIGKNKLFPRVSPNKTWEGAMGGVAGALALGALAKVTVLSDVFGWGDVLVLGLCCGAASQLGDLAESLFKRSAGVKDSGRSLPGHGGMLDRVDAAIVAVALMAAYAQFVRGWIV